MARPTVLAWNLDVFTRNGLAALCEGLGLELVRVGKADYAMPIGALAGIPVRSPAMNAKSEDFSAPMLVMCHLLSDQFNAFLEALRGSGLPRIPLKAVLTPTNVAWSSYQLYEELCREHEAMSRR